MDEMCKEKEGNVPDVLTSGSSKWDLNWLQEPAAGTILWCNPGRRVIDSIGWFLSMCRSCLLDNTGNPWMLVNKPHCRCRYSTLVRESLPAEFNST